MNDVTEANASEVDENQAENPDVPAKSKKELVSAKAFLDSDGVKTVRLEDAKTLSYITISTSTEHVYEAQGDAGARGTMGELFGIKTKLTNVASTARQQGKDEDSEIADFLAGLSADIPIWRERSSGGGAANKYDKDIIVQAMIAVATDTGREPKSAEEYMEVIAGRGMVVKVMNMPTIRAAYDVLADTDDEAAIDSVL